ncbi:short-chain dehydrogenase/reductase family Oxidoreductase [Colletotrichum higginsianum IMI 349063]|uniref:Short-chain dehydrogenase/reductase family Oxidoreductase n=1 Tax=Colletotrichum higginsianum (strain IMI 349063) TaxID=759273 RepID=A0A1B7YGD7_COLHI|nr:short-chain dehydrogenase/reductase family Oxidoreductase [Colletotrichum higginsianum IMI 349063]OBR11137.1 short-chain dehydrogenase/reductase family Oxidoreductase [Colletotrichum higginsianum IMI 349063]
MPTYFVYEKDLVDPTPQIPSLEGKVVFVTGDMRMRIGGWEDHEHVRTSSQPRTPVPRFIDEEQTNTSAITTLA